MRHHDPAKAVQVLDLLLAFFEDGRCWIQGTVGDYQGNHCLIGGLRHVRTRHAIKGDGAGYYLADALPPEYRRLDDYNDDADSFAEVCALILIARELAQAELGQAEPVETSQPARIAA